MANRDHDAGFDQRFDPLRTNADESLAWNAPFYADLEATRLCPGRDHSLAISVAVVHAYLAGLARSNT